MNVKILKEYCNKCQIYGWRSTWEGLKKYALLKEKGLIELWTNQKNVNKSLNGISVANLDIQSKIGIKLVPICVGTQVALIRIEELVSDF